MPRKKNKKQRPRGTSPHPGVMLIKRKRDKRVMHIARFINPATGRQTDLSLDKLGIDTDAGRTEWAKAKSDELAALARAPDASSAGSLRREAEDYLERCGRELRPRTVKSYRAALRPFLEWAAENDVDRLSDITKRALFAYADWVRARPRRRPTAGGCRGETEATGEQRSVVSVNREIRQVGTFLRSCRDREVLPLANIEDIDKALSKSDEPRRRPPFLRPTKIKKLLKAAKKHDEVTFKLTRDEHDGKRPKGTTPRYYPSEPLVLTALLTGCRIGELRSLTWEHLYLEPPDRGELTVSAWVSKTKRERAVDLSVCPSLVLLLGALRLRFGGRGFVFGGDRQLTSYDVRGMRLRLVEEFGSPHFTWQQLRQTAASYLASAPGIFGGGSAYREAAQLGHSVRVAEEHYVGIVKNIPKDAETLEAAMGIVEQAEGIVRRASVGAEATGGQGRSSAG